MTNQIIGTTIMVSTTREKNTVHKHTSGTMV